MKKISHLMDTLLVPLWFIQEPARQILRAGDFRFSNLTGRGFSSIGCNTSLQFASAAGRRAASKEAALASFSGYVLDREELQ